MFAKIKVLVMAVIGVGFIMITLIANANERTIPTDYALTKLTDRVYVIHGPNEPPSKKNRGFRNNPVLVKTSEGIVIIDPGSSVYTGELVVKKARSLSDKPIIAIFNTHAHGDHWLGNHGIQKHFREVVIYAHPKMKIGIDAGDGEMWIKAINKRTEGMIKGTKVVGPTKTVQQGDRIKLGSVSFRIYHNGKAHSDSDLMIEIVEEKVLIFGDNWRNKNVGIFMASFSGNLAALDIGLATKAKYFVPGHGKSGDENSVKSYRDFIVALKKQVKKHFEADLSDFEMKPKVIKALQKYNSWVGFDENIGRLINLAYLEVENESF